ncbi:MAG: translesion DNA synthesis-associated protein ImuA [Betaproteobacteria bacterium]|nr:translesion DNA synthesis-associated protein ImuA [Betaproteobacteria bacterium]
MGQRLYIHTASSSALASLSGVPSLFVRVDAAGVDGAAGALDAVAALHPGLWRPGHQGARSREPVVASGFAALDAALPGGGWPAGVLTELLLPHAGVGELRLLAPVLARLQREQHGRCLMWFDPPARPCAWALEALGLAPAQMVVVRSVHAVPVMRPGRASRASPASKASKAPMASLWALEHALRSGHVGAVLAWLPMRLPADALRRLQLAAQGHEGPAFLLRDEAVAAQPSPAPLRLRLSAAAPDWLRVEVFKRRGPPLAQPLLLELPPVLARPARRRAEAGVRVAGAGTSVDANAAGPSLGSNVSVSWA